MSSDNTLLVAWVAVRESKEDSDIASARWHAGSAWGQPQTLASVTDSNVQLTMRANAKGEALLLQYAWEGQLLAHIYTSSGWGSPAELRSEGKFRDGTEPVDAILDELGNALVVLTQNTSDGGRTAVHGTSYTKESGWQRVIQLENESPRANVCDPRIKMAKSGSALMVWTDFRSSMFSKRFNPQSGWNAATRIFGEDSSIVERCRVSLEMNSVGEALAVFQQTAQTSQLRALTFSEATLWSDVTTLLDTGAPATGYFQHTLVMNKEGMAFLVWVEVHGKTSRTWARSFSLHGSWGEPTALSEEFLAPGYRPSVAIDVAGNAVAAWLQYDAQGTASLWANRFEVGSGWDKALRVDSDELVRPWSPSVAISAEGTPIIVWASNVRSSPAAVLLVTSWQP